MATSSGILAAIKTLKANFTHYKAGEELIDILQGMLAPYPDDVLAQAVRHLIATQSRTPLAVDILTATQDVERRRAALCASEAKPQYTEYWQRSPQERAEIDEAKAEFHRIWNALESGTPVAELFPYDSEACKLARHYAELGRGVNSDPVGTVFEEAPEPTRAQERNKFRVQPDYDW